MVKTDNDQKSAFFIFYDNGVLLRMLESYLLSSALSWFPFKKVI